MTGGARRLGREIALELAAHGWDVALHYRSSAAEAEATVQELRERGAEAQAFAADLADEAACRALVPAVHAHFGRLQAVVNNASLFEHDDVHSFSPALMERHWRSNVAPAVLLAQALHAQLGEGQTGCVVNLLDQKLWNPNPDYLSYTLSKAALEAANTLLAQALAPRVRVCGVAPGVTLPSGPMDAAGFEQAHRLHAAAALVHRRRHRARGALPARIAGDHRHHAAGRWRPAPVAPGPRRDVPPTGLR